MSQKSFEKPLYNERVIAGKKTYFMDVRKTSNNKIYVTITETYTEYPLVWTNIPFRNIFPHLGFRD